MKENSKEFHLAMADLKKLEKKLQNRYNYRINIEENSKIFHFAMTDLKNNLEKFKEIVDFLEEENKRLKDISKKKERILSTINLSINKYNESNFLEEKEPILSTINLLVNEINDK
ncbi:13692_t:CDS:2 [Funneliformis mosseae]|uniref:13692_t:CDS:1 n=1 Tax=Funneliformis mosseae TaxID=27381 RepID=A0A9N9A0Y6_FUNMO|nr:13692_t:CDS:2 [Funneliformis mosseae]